MIRWYQLRTLCVRERRPLKDQPADATLEPNHQSILFSSVTETITTTPATDDWLVATTGIPIPTSPVPESPPDEPDFVEIPESHPEPRTSVAPTIEEVPVLNSITDLAEPNEENPSIAPSRCGLSPGIRSAATNKNLACFRRSCRFWEVDRFFLAAIRFRS